MTPEFLLKKLKCQRTAGSFMKPTEFFEVFEITVISGSLILKFGLFFFPKNRN